LKKLEKLLPPRRKIDIPAGENVEEVSMMDFENTKGSSRSQEHGHGASYMRQAFGGGDDDDDDDEDGPGGAQRVDCNTH
jgi:hypothetical protein